MYCLLQIETKGYKLYLEFKLGFDYVKTTIGLSNDQDICLCFGWPSLVLCQQHQLAKRADKKATTLRCNRLLDFKWQYLCV